MIAPTAPSDLIRTIHADAMLLIETAHRERMGFLSASDVAALAADGRTRLTKVLVRCGNGRFTCSAQDVAWFVGIITASGKEHVRDVSLPVSR
jgi:hypothetical protein